MPLSKGIYGCNLLHVMYHTVQAKHLCGGSQESCVEYTGFDPQETCCCEFLPESVFIVFQAN